MSETSRSHYIEVKMLAWWDLDRNLLFFEALEILSLFVCGMKVTFYSCAYGRCLILFHLSLTFMKYDLHPSMGLIHSKTHLSAM